MIFDKMENIFDYFDELPSLRKVNDFVEDFSSKKLEDGTYEIDGGRVFAMVDFTLTKGVFLLLYPEDAHLPGLSAQKDVNVRKIVFKKQID